MRTNVRVDLTRVQTLTQSRDLTQTNFIFTFTFRPRLPNVTVKC